METQCACPDSSGTVAFGDSLNYELDCALRIKCDLASVFICLDALEPHCLLEMVSGRSYLSPTDHKQTRAWNTVVVCSTSAEVCRESPFRFSDGEGQLLCLPVLPFMPSLPLQFLSFGSTPKEAASLRHVCIWGLHC